MKQGVTKCEWCLIENSNKHTQCTKCGGPVAVLEPWVLQCGWCKASNRRDLVNHCSSCGGELPHIPGTPRQPEPPVAPRNLTSGYKTRIKYTGNTLMLIGIIFTIVGIPIFIGFLLALTAQAPQFLFIPFFALLFPVIGIWAILKSGKKANQKLYALQFGVPTRGLIKNVYIDTNQSINNVHPVTIEYSFDHETNSHVDTVTVWDHGNLKRPAGEHIWVVFNPKALQQNNVWPPLR